MADATKVILCLLSEKTEKKEMNGGCNESHSLFAIRKDRQKGNGCLMQQKVIPFLPPEKTQKKKMDAGCNESHSLVEVRTLTKRKWMADATEVIPFLLSEKTDKKGNDVWNGGCNESHSLFAVRKDRQKGNYFICEFCKSFLDTNKSRSQGFTIGRAEFTKILFPQSYGFHLLY